MRIPVTVAAKNEEAGIGACLDALLSAKHWAEARGEIAYDLLVVLDECTDGTEAAVARRGVPFRHASGGKVEAQRSGLREGPFSIFLDADVLVSPETLDALSRLMLERPSVQVAFPPKRPLPPRRQTRLARALHAYNRTNGFSSQRSWFNGKCFAIRRWRVPTREALQDRIERLGRDRFYAFEGGLRAEDVYLSRALAAEWGADAFAQSGGCVTFRAPETLRGMYRYYLRLRRELERVSLLFPELEGAHASLGRRRPDLLATASRSDRIAYFEFQAWLALCRLRYRLERAYYQRLAREPCAAWQPIEETKCLLGTDIPA